jgi:hypothetical protein
VREAQSGISQRSLTNFWLLVRRIRRTHSPGFRFAQSGLRRQGHIAIWREETLFACSILVTAAPIAQAVAQQAAPPDFSSNNVGWVGLNPDISHY